MVILMKLLYASLIFFLLFPAVSGQEFQSYSVRADVVEDGVFEDVEITFSGISELSYVVEGDVEEVFVASRDGEILYNVEKAATSYVVASNLSDKGHLKLFFFTNAPLLRRNGEAEVLFKLRFPVDVDDFSVQVILPKYALPVSTEDDFSIFPTPDKQFTEDNRYNVIWRRSNLSGNAAT
jgi:hypothetical protein